MITKIIFYLMVILASVSCRPSKKNQKSSPVVKAYIRRIGLDSISRTDLLQDNVIRFTKEEIKIIHAVAYFDQGSFRNVQQQIFTGNRLGFVYDSRIADAKTPFRISVDDIRYKEKNGSTGFAEGFSFIVY
ncbi:MAG: hypothetical protein JWQ27_210 [Ferruginibacter sp.]|nr:hypothetical protein [Ferruginibacter sp.]